MFATPNGVTNTTVENWAAAIRKDFGYELVVMSREDIITSLMDPSNAAVCRTHLGLPVALEPNIVGLGQQAREGTSEVIATWSFPLAGKPLIDLRAVKMDQEGKDANEVFHLGNVRSALAQSRRVVIEAPAGRGKTTTLVQLANQHSSSGGLAFLIDLPAWIKSGTNVLQFIGGMPAFQSRSITAEALARLYKAEHFSFLLNGWNEIAESDSLQAVQALRELERNFPSAGILVATRTHHIVPPLPGALRVRLLPLNRTERAQYLHQRLGSRANELRSKLDSDPVLDELTRTPLILSEVTVIFEAGAPIPKTNIGVLGSVMRLLEQSEEHSSHLQLLPLNGRAHEYLGALATGMTEHGAVTMPEQNARTIVNLVAVKLRDAGQIAALPEPSAVLNALCAHHVLERVVYPAISFRFEHQQFQEFYVALLLKRQLLALNGKDGAQEIQEFTKRYVNEPVWSEPLRMIAEEIGVASAASPSDVKVIRSGVLLIEMALNTDPVYAAELSRLCGASVWREIRSVLTHRLRSLYQVPDEHWRRCALAGMLASGFEEFKDIILPPLSTEDRQVRLSTYRTGGGFHVSSLGPDWRKTVSGWNEEVRAEFVTEVLHFGNGAQTVASFALADGSLRVRKAAISAMVWISSSEDVARLLGTLDEETFEAAVQELPPQSIPGLLWPRALAVYRKLYDESTDAVRRLRVLLHIAELGGTSMVDNVKDELGKCDPGKLGELGHFVIKPALDIVRRTDSEWVSHWVANRIVDGALWRDDWIMLVTSVPQDLKERLVQRIENEDFKHVRDSGVISVLAAASDAGLVERVFSKLCGFRQIFASAPDERHEFEWAIERQLEDLFRALPLNVAVGGLSTRLSGAVEAIELNVVTRLFSRVGRDDSDLRAALHGNLRQSLRAYLKNGVPVMLREEDFSGEQKANLASALAQVGEPEDMAAMRELIQADIKRVRKGLEARAQGNRGRLGNGAVMSYSLWHVQAIVLLDPDAADTVLLDVLKEPEYERDAAGALVQLARTSKVEAGFGKKRDYRDVWEARARQMPSGFNEERRKRYATAIRDRIVNILEENISTGQTAPYDFRLQELTKMLAVIDSLGSTDLILRVLSFPGNWSGWQRVQTLETLLFNGVVLPAGETLKSFDSILEQVRSHLYDSQQVGLLTQALCLLPFVDIPSTGIKKIRAVISDLKLRTYQLRDVVTALGHCRCHEAIGLLRELALDENHARQLGDSWINAVAELDSPKSRQLLLSFVDLEGQGLSSEMTFDREDVIAAHIVGLARRDAGIEHHLLQLCNMQLPSPKRALLSRVVGWLGTPEAALAGLNLIDDNATPAVPGEIWRLIEAAFVERRPYGKDSNAYTLAPRSSNPIRIRLFEMATKDKRRMKSAFSLLGQIEVWRLEHGRPNGEPRNPDAECKTSWLTAADTSVQENVARAG